MRILNGLLVLWKKNLFSYASTCSCSKAAGATASAFDVSILCLENGMMEATKLDKYNMQIVKCNLKP